MSNSVYNTRNLAIDMLRAVTMFVMIFVNDFWTVENIPYWMHHAKRGVDFMGLSDFVFPCFMFAVGMSIPYALERRYTKGYSVESTLGHILSRTFALWVMGTFIANSNLRLAADSPYSIGVYWILMGLGFLCVWNAYPKPKTLMQGKLFSSLKIVGVLILSYLAITFRGPEGEIFAFRGSILGSIAWLYLTCTIIYLFTRDRLKYLLPIFFAFVLFALLDTPMREELGGLSILNLPKGNFIDGMLGLLKLDNCVRVCFTLGGVLLTIYSARFQDRKIGWRFGSAMALAAIILILGVISHRFWIVAKLGSTPPWLFYATAASVAMYGIFRLLDHYKITAWYKLLAPAGTATLTCYIVPYVFYGFADITGIVLPEVLTTGFISILNCLCFSGLIVAVVYLLERVRIKLKV